MDKENKNNIEENKIDEMLKGFDAPAPSKEKKEATLKAAMEAFEEESAKKKKTIKGFDDDARLISESKFISFMKGVFPMRKPVMATFTIVAIGAILMAIAIPQFSNVRKVSNNKGYQTPTVEAPTAKEPIRIKESKEDSSTASKPSSSNSNRGEGTKPKSTTTSGGMIVEGDSIDTVAEAHPVPRHAPEMEAYDMAPPPTSPAPVVSHNSEPLPVVVLSKSKNEAGYDKKVRAKKSQALTQGLTSGYAAPNDLSIAQVNPEYVGRDKFEHKEQNPVKLTSSEPVSTFSIDVDTASYSFVRRAVKEGYLPQKDAVRVEELINYFDYDYEAPKSRKNPFKPTIAVYPTPWNKNTKLMHIGIKGHEVDKSKRPKANLVFLIDVSGSMSMDGKLPLLKNSFKLMVEELNPEDRVAIAVYAGAAGVVLEPTEAKNRTKIISALDKLTAGGSTAGGAGIELAYSLAEQYFEKDAINRVILTTDGDFNVGITNNEALTDLIERKRDKGIYLSVLGFGHGNYNDQLMQSLAQNGNGNAAYIDTLNEARKVLVEEAGSTLFTIAKDVKIQVEFNPARVSEYRLIGYETRMLNREDFNNDKVDAGEVGAGHSVTAIYEITEVGSEGRLVDDLRYGDKEKTLKPSGEYGFLKIRYKLPDQSESKLITRPITKEDEYLSFDKVPTDIRFAASVAGFGQILKGGKHTGNFTIDDCKAIARKSRGEDPYGYRAEFINILSLTNSAKELGNR